jgi:hypothetical protein
MQAATKLYQAVQMFLASRRKYFHVSSADLMINCQYRRKKEGYGKIEHATKTQILLRQNDFPVCLLVTKHLVTYSYTARETLTC